MRLGGDCGVKACWLLSNASICIHVLLLQSHCRGLTLEFRETSWRRFPGQGKLFEFPSLSPSEQIQVSERAEKHPETALDPNTQPHLVLMSEHRGSQGHRLRPTLAPFYR